MSMDRVNFTKIELSRQDDEAAETEQPSLANGLQSSSEGVELHQQDSKVKVQESRTFCSLDSLDNIDLCEGDIEGTPSTPTPSPKHHLLTAFSLTQASDAGGFNEVLDSQLSNLRALLIAEHDKRVSSLQAQIEVLRGQLPQVQNGSKPAVHNGGGPDILEPGLVLQLPQELPSPKTPARRSVARKASASKHLREMAQNTSLSPKRTGDRTQRLYDSEGLKLKRLRSTIDFNKKADMLTQIVENQWFEMVSGAIIMANTVIIALQMQYDGFDAGLALGWRNMTESASETWPGAKMAFDICNILFNCLFALELVLRIGAHRLKSLRMPWIWFDTIVVTVGIVDIFAQDALAFNPGMMRVLRLFRLVRLLKVFQSMSSFDSLFLLLKAIRASREALVWSFLILGLVQLIVGLFLCQILQDVINDEDADMEAREVAYMYFGTFSKTMLTMFEITMANWVVSARSLMRDVSEWFILFFILYRCMFCFAILRVIAAVFITETNRVLEHDDELTIMKRNREKMLFQAKLTATFKAIDTTGKGKFGWKELDALTADHEIVDLVTTLGFDVHDFEKLFWLLDDGSGEISIHEFVNKMGKLKGQSKTIDMLTMLKLAHRIDQKIQTVFEKQGLLERNELELAEEDLACRV